MFHQNSTCLQVIHFAVQSPANLVTLPASFRGNKPLVDLRVESPTGIAGRLLLPPRDLRTEYESLKPKFGFGFRQNVQTAQEVPTRTAAALLSAPEIDA